MNWFNRPPWRPKGVGALGGCAPARTKHGKLKHKCYNVPKSYLSNSSRVP